MGEYLENLKELRLKNKYSQREVAEYLGISNAAYSLYELGKREPNIAIIKKLAKYYNVSPSELIGWDDQPTTVAAHKDGDNFTPDELAKIEEYKKLLLAARPKESLNADTGATPEQAAAADAIMQDDAEWKIVK